MPHCSAHISSGFAGAAAAAAASAAAACLPACLNMPRCREHSVLRAPMRNPDFYVTQARHYGVVAPATTQGLYAWADEAPLCRGA
jgi:hypothetical protein